MFLPSCDRCGRCGCACGRLPYTLTVTFSGLENRTHTQHCALSFSSPFGCGAAGVALSPGGCISGEPECGASNVGPLAAVLLTNPGHGYARPARQEPVLTVTGSGTGATLTPAIGPVDDTLAVACQSWKLASVAVSGGTGYTYGETLTIGSDGVTLAPAVATLETVREAPTITATAPSGTGAVLAVTLSSGGSPTTWSVASVSVTSGGTGYADGASVTFSVVAGDQVVTEAVATIVVTGTSPPTPVLTITSYDDPPGSGAEFTLTWEPSGNKWQVASVNVVNVGSGYFSGGVASWEHPDGYTHGIYAGDLIVDENGAITGVSVQSAEDFDGVSGTGAISSVSVTDGGSYWHETGVPDSVTVVIPGEYYKDDPTAPPCIADVNVTLNECYATGDDFTAATIEATVGDDPDDPATFGTITGLSVSDGGAGYLVWHWLCSSLAGLNGEPLVLKAVDPTPLVTLGVNACYGSGACIKVVPTGEEITCESEPTIRTAAYDGGPSPIRAISLESGGSGYAKFGREEPQWTVTQSGWTFTPTFGASETDDCGLDYWPVESFAISGSGTTMTHGEGLLIVMAGVEKCDAPARAYVVTEDGIPQSVVVTRAGRYYRENAALTPYVADVTVSIDQLPPSAGSGCEVSVVVEDDPADADFGKIISATLESQGSGYTLLGAPRGCVYRSDPCGSAYAPRIELRLRGHGRSPDLVLTDNRVYPGTEIVLRSADTLTDCDDLPTNYTLLYGAESGVTATITAGGAVETPCDPPAWCVGCVCPLDGIADLGSTPVSYTSNCLACAAGTVSGSGTIDNLDSDCLSEENVMMSASVTVICCDADCVPTGECVKKLNVIFEGYIPTGNPDPLLTYAYARGESGCTDALTIVDGVLTGVVSVPVVDIGNQGLVDCTVTVTLG